MPAWVWRDVRLYFYFFDVYYSMRPTRLSVLTYCMQRGVLLCVGLLFMLRGFIVLAFGSVSLGPHCFLPLSSAGLIVVLVPGCCWAYSAFFV